MGEQLPLDIALRDEATLERFVSGKNAELIDVLTHIQPEQGHMIMITGTHGSGKTHLLQAVCRRNNYSFYLPLSLLDEYSSDAFEGLSSRAMICLDDVHLIAGNRDKELALFGLINEIRDAGNTFIFTSTQPYDQAGFGLLDLVSRLAACVQYVLELPNDEHKAAWLRDDSARRGLELGDDVINWILTHTARDMPSLTSLMALLDRESLRSQRKITIPFIKEMSSKYLE